MRWLLVVAFACACDQPKQPAWTSQPQPARDPPPAVVAPPSVARAPVHPAHEHPHGPHPHPASDHHHHPHPHPHLDGPNGHHLGASGFGFGACRSKLRATAAALSSVHTEANMWNDRSAARVSLVVIAVAWCAGAWVWTRTIAESPSATIAPAAMVVRDVAIDTLAERGDRDLLAGKTEEALAAYRELAALVPADGRACEPQPGIEEPAYCPAAPPTAAPPSSPR